MMWSFPPSFPVVSLWFPHGSQCVTMQEHRGTTHKHVEMTSRRPKSVTGKFLMTVSLEILTFLLKPVQFKAGNSVDLPAVPGLNLTGFSEKVNILELLVM